MTTDAARRPRTHYSFVVDAPSSAVYPYQAYLLTLSLIDLAAVDPSDITAFFVSGTDASIQAEFERTGVNTATVEPFGHLYCNRLQQFAPLAEKDADRFILLDTDMFALRPLELPGPWYLCGKIVDAPNPPPDVLETIFAEADQRLECVPTDVVAGATARANFNGGLYAVPRDLLEQLAESWTRWARWSLDHLELYRDWSHNVDQVSFALAVAERDFPLGVLPREFNVPTHLGPAAAVGGSPYLLHYHRSLDAELLLEPTGDSGLDAAIDTANDAISSWRREEPAGQLFRSARQALHPGLDSDDELEGLAHPAFQALDGSATGHPRDASAQTIRGAVPFVDDPGALLESAELSRRELGFFPDHLPRFIEYPWVLNAVRAGRPKPGRVLDVGAGVSVLPLLLHDDGHQVTTVDSHALRRTAEWRSTWNEWGFLDYAELRAGISSHNVPYESYEPSDRHDVVYSVSVIEHLPAAVRREWLARMANGLEPGGLLLLTVDLEPMTRALWNRSEGVIVEPSDEHGTLDDLLTELRRAGFAIDETKVHEQLPLARAGLAMIRASLAQPSPSGSGRTVTVLVPAYRPGGRFVGLLESFAAQTYDDIVVRVGLDHAPDHEMPALPDMHGKRLELIVRTERLGWVGNMNALLDSVSSPFYQVIMHDDQVTPTYVEECVRALERNQDAVVAHGFVRHHGIRDGQRDAADSIRGDRHARVATYLQRQPHLTGLGFRGVVRSDVLRKGVRFRARRSDGQFTNDLYALELIVHGESASVPDVCYDKFTDPGGLSRDFHRRTFEEKSAMLADNLACFTDVLVENGFSDGEMTEFTAAYAAWLLGLQGNWNVVGDGPSSDAETYGEVRPHIARFVANTLTSLRSAERTAPTKVAIPANARRRRVTPRRRLRRLVRRATLRLPRVFRRNPLFDARWYVTHYPDVAGGRLPPYFHYWRHGIAEGRDPNEYFDSSWYLATYDDVRERGMDPLDHYLVFGAREGRDPGPAFSTRAYLRRNPDVAAAGLNPLLHWLRYGRHEGRALR